ncbi:MULTISPECIES: flagellar motor protein MotB [unclassified Tatumella]|uniref:flagellar motor protein MotB n=1 Tax=unclassified Tatumella TaxID=2649542 RepID=UPI001BB0630B|nr:MULTISPECIES: flagellar motor protein MotB [unclassified Tatumella]MBS0855423.1 flagellar motor protein MotB [Tatumella sp. JGM16]MBS0911657.1 flagellar motor protein MotB [Tatumella sp. JGM91]
MKPDERQIVVVKKRKSSGHHESHGSWKIAYADFMTAMMAFFMVMWLIAVSTPKELQQIAEYFKMPLRVALSGGQRSSDSVSPVPGGGNDITQKQGETLKTPRKTDSKHQRDVQQLKKLKKELESLLLNDPRLKALRPHLLITVVSGGLRIQIIDSKQRPMFLLGSAEVEPYMRTLLQAIAPVLNDVPNKISIAGHTDDFPYQDGEKGFSNWELSANRANASRRELVRGGLNQGKVLRVVGMADTMKLKDLQGDDAENRRISLLVLNQDAEEAIEKENREEQAITISDPSELSQHTSAVVPVPAPDTVPAIARKGTNSFRIQQPAGVSGRSSTVSSAIIPSDK